MDGCYVPLWVISCPSGVKRADSSRCSEVLPTMSRATWAATVLPQTSDDNVAEGNGKRSTGTWSVSLKHEEVRRGQDFTQSNMCRQG